MFCDPNLGEGFLESIGLILIIVSSANEPAHGYVTEYVTCGQCTCVKNLPRLAR